MVPDMKGGGGGVGKRKEENGNEGKWIALEVEVGASRWQSVS